MKSYISSIYDPLGFAAPFLLERRRIYKDFVIRAYGGTAKSAVL